MQIAENQKSSEGKVMNASPGLKTLHNYPNYSEWNPKSLTSPSKLTNVPTPSHLTPRWPHLLLIFVLLSAFQPHCPRGSSMTFPGKLQRQNFCTCCSPAWKSPPPECPTAYSLPSCTSWLMPSSSGGPSLSTPLKPASPLSPSSLPSPPILPLSTQHHLIFRMLYTSTCVCLPPLGCKLFEDRGVYLLCLLLSSSARNIAWHVVTK